MRIQRSGVWHIGEIIAEGLEGRDIELSKPQRVGLADLVASILTCCSVNTSKLANVLPVKLKAKKKAIVI